MVAGATYRVALEVPRTIINVLWFLQDQIYALRMEIVAYSVVKKYFERMVK